jgi:hypothetical protein
MPIKTFRGQMADGAIDTILLHTKDGSTGYRIVKFQIIPFEIANKVAEHVIKIYKVDQTTATGTMDFSDNTLLGAAFVSNDTSAHAYPPTDAIIFDQEVFNQDIYVTHKDRLTGEACNYYIELEQVKLDLNQNTVATLKDIRNVTG